MKLEYDLLKYKGMAKWCVKKLNNLEYKTNLFEK